MGTEKGKRKCPRGSAAFRIARNTDYCQGADDSYIGLHRVSVNPFPQAHPSRITQLDWRSCVSGETSVVAGVVEGGNGKLCGAEDGNVLGVAFFEVDAIEFLPRSLRRHDDRRVTDYVDPPYRRRQAHWHTVVSTLTRQPRLSIPDAGRVAATSQ